MPVQINEVIIRAVVDTGTSAGHSSETTEPPSANTGTEAEIAEKVMEILKEKKER
ncbi:MAG: hypothetical protein JWQ40_4457 [Segetibacter sp.]|jgi:hypothetical protein|nr:hypothetical protein [Segetibacter sp.]